MPSGRSSLPRQSIPLAARVSRFSVSQKIQPGMLAATRSRLTMLSQSSAGARKEPKQAAIISAVTARKKM